MLGGQGRELRCLSLFLIKRNLSVFESQWGRSSREREIIKVYDKGKVT